MVLGLGTRGIQKRIQICSQVGGQRGQNGVGFGDQRDTEKDTDMQLDRRIERAECYCVYRWMDAMERVRARR